MLWRFGVLFWLSLYRSSASSSRSLLSPKPRSGAETTAVWPLAGTIVGASLLAVQLLALLALILYGVPFFQKAYRDVQRQDDVATFRVWLEEHSDSEDQLPDEDTFADGVPDLNLTYYNSLAEVVDSNTDDADREHILYVRDGQPTEDTYYPNLDSLHVWGGSLCDSETFSISGDTYADGTIEPASPEDWAIVYRVEVTEGEDGISVTEGLICEDKNTVPSANFDFE